MRTDLLVQFEIIFPAFVAGVLVVATHVPLGQEVLRRGIVFLDLAIAQMAALGVVVASVFGRDFLGGHLDHLGALGQYLVPCTASVITAIGLYRLHRLETATQEALIGITFVLAATGSMLLVAHDPHGGELLQKTLAGQILWVQFPDLLAVSIIYGAILVVWHLWKDRWGAAIFYPLFAIAITISTQLIGVYLVFASLIIPALTTKALKIESERQALAVGYGLGGLAYGLGLLFSAMLDLPSGPTVVWTVASISLLAWLIARKTKTEKHEHAL